MKIQPTPLTAAVAGAAAALAWPAIANHAGETGDAWNIDLVVLTLLAIALPAHLLVVGLQRPAPAAGRQVDTALLKRVAVWLAVAVGVTLVRSALGD